MTKPRKLNMAEIAGINAAQSQLQEAGQRFENLKLAFIELQKSIGLDPSKQYRLEEDGTVIEIQQE